MFSKVGVIGAGQMGLGIAQSVAQKKIPVILFDKDDSHLEKALEKIKVSLEKFVSKGKLTPQDKDQVLKLIEPQTRWEPLKDCDLVVEAVTEDLELKKTIFKKLDEICPPQTILCSNTSSLPIGEISKATKRPSQVAGMHFMNPVPLMKLVEGVKGDETSPETFEKVKEFSEFLGKVFVASKDRPGFIVNRVLMPMINEAAYALKEGVASKEDIDEAMKHGSHHPMGPLALADLIGLDTCLAILEVLHKGVKGFRPPCSIFRECVDKGFLGRKKGKGFYDYTSP